MSARMHAPPLAVVDDALFDEHRPRGYHPERPERLYAARSAVERCVAEGMQTRDIASRDATDEELSRVHDIGYVESLAPLAGHYASLDPDTYLAPSSVAAARRAAGASIALVDALMQEPTSAKNDIVKHQTQAGLALLRPPGHHATRRRGMGFCLFNNVAVAAAHAVAKGVPRVAIIDWDVHHGNGTQDIFWSDPHVLYMSLHQFPFYPGTGSVLETGGDEAPGHSVNVPLSAGAGDAVYTEAFRRIVTPILDEFAPELVLVSAGFDAHRRDPLAEMCVTDEGYAIMATAVTQVALRHAQGRIGFFLEGGYDLTALSSSLASVLHASLATASADSAPLSFAPMSFRHEDELSRARKAAAAHWHNV
ncbi:MAG TPA: histone deacetylase [Polyangium sp.]|nr:histone deacetylase [Polyangium sp.]